MQAYYNENDPKAAAWLRELIKFGLIAPGVVDIRSIEDVRPDELTQYTQCHFFAGIGGWSYALRLAGWTDDRPVWTGSCPCQPYSTAGKGKGIADERHLWPAWFWLIKQCRPDVIFGEQVEAAINHGWLDLVCSDLEAEGYRAGAIGLPACGVGAPHIRQRLWFVADANNERSQGRSRVPERADQCAIGSNGVADGLDVAQTSERRELRNAEEFRAHAQTGRSGETCRLAESNSARREPGQWHHQATGHGNTVASESCNDGLADTEHDRCCRSSSDSPESHRNKSHIGLFVGGHSASKEQSSTDTPDGIWRNPDWLFCRDGKWRPVESSLLGVVDGLPDELVRGCNISRACNPLAKEQEARAMRLKGYGNAIVPIVAAEVIKAYMETTL